MDPEVERSSSRCIALIYLHFESEISPWTVEGQSCRRFFEAVIGREHNVEVEHSLSR